ncbi:carboxyl transferase domain-containing protein [Acrocarpospora macrocephala]|uniref:Acetyl-CoA carboxylase carboxyltransferase subunit beta n=1 Tax=Acrocarpospora macrocephala TaxID=150177 RepID=A0A5M3WKA7_9ACTN|nr:carboxyl transferase domain-containing protein [Acrocarpospora macrocephala]GES09066.1 acetyl-CoA carboxylase carboxyltransferase subunit beta [Acrocarpospora macrocephala]
MSVFPVSASARLSFAELRDLVLDTGSWQSWDSPVERGDIEAQYAETLRRARESSRHDESVVTGEARLRGRRVAVIAGEVSFLAGSVGVAAAKRVMAAVERATAQRLPLLGAPVSGGTRMQEGTLAFVQMVGIAAAIAQHKAAGLPYLVYLRSPTFGGVLASWGSLGHITVGEPHAAIGFLGPRVYMALHGEPFPAGVQTAEHMVRHGLLDGVVPPEHIAELADRTLRVLTAPRPQHPPHRFVPAENGPPDDEVDGEAVESKSAWNVVASSRRSDRPGIRRLLRISATDVVPLSGSGIGEREPGLVLALARFSGTSCVVLGQDRGAQHRIGPFGPAVLREARRGIRLSHDLGLPLVTAIDTPGASLSARAEEGGLAAEIARCLHDLVTLRSPSLAVLLGPGAGGGALAFLPADRVIAAANGWVAPLPPEGASAIVHRDLDHAPTMAQEQGIRAIDLWRAGIVDRIVPERPDAADEPDDFCRRLGRAIGEELTALRRRPDDERHESRWRRYRELGDA